MNLGGRMLKTWNITKYEEEEVNRRMQTYGISEVLAKLLIAREIDFEEIPNFLHGTLEDLRDPFLMKDMDKFVERIKEAIDKKEKICIYGDYDVDGITSISIMYEFLTQLGGDVSYYLPNRLLEGYGINIPALDEIKKKGVTLVITVDCGITAVEEVKYAKSIGLDVCITDHHECSELVPSCIAVVNPKQSQDKFPFKMHAGVGVAYKCITALGISYQMPAQNYQKYLDIVAIGTISDIVPLVDENRIISKIGLEQMKHTKNVGLKALLEITSYKEIDSIMVSFGMAPRINACGRMGNAGVAVELLLEKDEKRAKLLAEKLNQLNTQRQMVEKDIFDKAEIMIKTQKLEAENSLVLYDASWHNGVIGIVASRLVNIYCKPVILLTKENGVIRGSGRCQNGFSLYDALSACNDTLVQFGGHELAAGLTVEEEKIEEFARRFNEVVTHTSSHLKEKIVEIDMEIGRKDLNIQTIKDIKMLKPYGQCNKTPIFLYKNLKVHAIRTIKDEKHLKLTLQDGKSLIEALAFSQGARRDELHIGDKIDVVCNIELNSYHLPKTVQLILQDFKKCVE